MLLKNYELRYTVWEGKVCYFVHKGCVLSQMYPVRILVHFCKTTPNVTLLPKPVSHRFSLSFTPCDEKKLCCSHCLPACYVSCPCHSINFIALIIYTKSSFYFVTLFFVHICSQASLISLLFFSATTRRVTCNLT